MMKVAEIELMTLDDHITLQNLARFYVYDMSRTCGLADDTWAIPANGLYECFDFKDYIIEPSRQAYFVKVRSELAGFVLINKATWHKESDWNMGEFFILARFQRQGIGQEIVKDIFATHPGKWEITVIPENQPAYDFWQKTINKYIGDAFTEKSISVEFDKVQPTRILFSFDVMPRIGL